MHLYNLTLQRPGAVNAAVFGNFTAPRQQEIVCAHGHTLELLRPDESGKLQTISSTNVFGLVRAILAFRLFAGDRDYLVVSSDSGRIAIVEWDAEARGWKRVHLETYGKTGMRRITPGQYLAADPKGRAIMVAGVEKGKLVYVLTRVPPEPLTISSPLEAHKSHALTWDVVGTDVGLDNPVFAALELDYAECDADATGEAAAAKHVVYYELDLGLNTMTRKWSRATDRGANGLVAVPGGSDGPGGVLVTAENWVLYEHAGQPSVRTPLPRRADMPDERGLLITARAVHRQKGGGFFALLQSELGDLYKVTLTTTSPGGGGAPRVTDVVVSLFDTLPPAAGLAITRSGLLYAPGEGGNHLLYQFTGLGEDHTSLPHQPGGGAGAGGGSARPPPAVAHAVHVDDEGGDGGPVEVVVPTFSPRPLANLAKLDETPSLAPLTAMAALPPAAAAAVAAAAGGSGGSGSGLVTLCGRGPRSTLRLLREGCGVTDLAVSPMPGNPMGVFTLRAPGGGATAEAGSAGASSSAPDGAGTSASAGPHKYIAISFTNATLVLAVGEAVEEVPARDIGFSESLPTLAAGLLDDGSLLQVTSAGMRLTKAKRTSAWQAPGKRCVVAAAVNGRQVALALSGGDVKYFELAEGGGGGGLTEVATKSVGAEVTAVALGDVPPGRLRAPYLALSDSNNMVRIWSTDPGDPLGQAGAQALRTSAVSLAVVTLRVTDPSPTPHLFIGLSNGILTRVALDPVTGALTDPRSRFLGVRGVKLAAVTLGGAPAALALSTRPWVAYNHNGTYHGAALCTDTLEAAAPFCSESVPEGIVAIAGNTLRIFTVDRLGEGPHHQKVLPLRYTPRRIAAHPTNPRFAVVVEAEYDSLGQEARAQAAAQTEASPAGGETSGGSSSSSSSSGDSSSGVAVAAASSGSIGGGSSGSNEHDDDGMEVDDDMEVEGAGASSSAAAPPPSSLGVGTSVAAQSTLLAPPPPSPSFAPPFPPGALPPHSTSTFGEALPDVASLAAEVSSSVDPCGEGGGVDVRRVGPPLPPSPGCWASALRVVDLAALGGSSEPVITRLHHAGVTHHLFDLPPDTAATCAAGVTFHDAPGQALVVVGVAHGLRYGPRTHTGGALHVYRFVEVDVAFDGAGAELPPGASSPPSSSVAAVARLHRLQFLHATPVEEPPSVVAGFAGRLLAGVGRCLRMYDLGVKRLLRKCELRGLPTGVTCLAVSGSARVFVGDASESVHAVKYRRGDNALVVLADDTVPRHVTALALLDHDTVAVGDKFGSVAVLRVPDDVADDADGSPAGGGRALWDAAVLNGAPHKLETVAQLYVGAAVTSLVKAPMGSGQEVLMYSTIHGGIGGMLPLTSKDDTEFFKHLELYLRSDETVSLVGRDHVSYRSYFMPVKDIFDGDLCEVYGNLPAARQRSLAEELDRTPHDVLKKLEDVRNKML